MSSIGTSAIICLCLFGAVFFGGWLRMYLPAHHRSADSRDAVRAAMGMVVTMAALLLGLLVASAKSAYDTKQSEVTAMAGKIVFLERVLAAYGPDADEARSSLMATVQRATRDLWSDDHLSSRSLPASAFFEHIQRLAPRDDTQRALKSQAATLATDLGQLRAMVEAQVHPSISRPMLMIVIGWLLVIFSSFSLLSPGNATVTLAQLVAALSVAAAMFLILELDRPFNGLIQISSQPILDALNAAAGSK